MDESTPNFHREVDTQVRKYLRAKGIKPSKFPSDMLRELTRLLWTESERHEMTIPQPDEDPGLAIAKEKIHHHDMVTFEMYLAAWIAKQKRMDDAAKVEARWHLD